MDLVDHRNLCRTCAGKTVDLTPIMSSLFIEDRVVMLSEILEPFINEPKINFPTMICNLCVEKAITIYKFKILCDKSTTFFQKCIENGNHDKVFAYGIDSKCNDVKDEKTTDIAISQVGAYKIKLEDVAKPYITTDNIVLQNFQDAVNCETSDCKTNTFSCNKNNIDNNNHNEVAENGDTPTPGDKIKCESGIGTLGVSNISKRKKQKIPTIHSDVDLFFCAECNKGFKNKYILIAHVRRHRNKGQFLCTVCGKGFNAQSCLSRHSRVHTGERKYECEVCHKKFPSSNNLKLHSRRHSGVKPYLCTLCGKCFSHPTGLTYHNRTHTKEKPYACDVCDSRFMIQCHLDRHKKSHSGERPFACDMCDRAFIKKFDLQRHQDVHLGNKPYVCGICEKAFVRKMHLDYHVMVHTKERPHVCRHCGKGFIRRYYLTSHVKKHHVEGNGVCMNDDGVS